MSYTSEKDLLKKLRSLLLEDSVAINHDFFCAFNGNFLKSAMLTKYVDLFTKNNKKEFVYLDKNFEESYFCSLKTIKRAKKYLKEEGFISVVQKGVPAIGYITVNLEKVDKIRRDCKNVS